MMRWQFEKDGHVWDGRPTAVSKPASLHTTYFKQIVKMVYSAYTKQ